MVKELVARWPLLLTCKKLLADFERVDQRGEDALDGAEHAAQAQVDQHEEEHDGPERRGREVGHGLCEGDEGQACALDSLVEGRKMKLSEVFLFLLSLFLGCLQIEFAVWEESPANRSERYQNVPLKFDFRLKTLLVPFNQQRSRFNMIHIRGSDGQSFQNFELNGFFKAQSIMGTQLVLTLVNGSLYF